jgi:hypothetical protein
MNEILVAEMYANVKALNNSLKAKQVRTKLATETANTG